MTDKAGAMALLANTAEATPERSAALASFEEKYRDHREAIDAWFQVRWSLLWLKIDTSHPNILSMFTLIKLSGYHCLLRFIVYSAKRLVGCQMLARASKLSCNTQPLASLIQTRSAAYSDSRPPHPRCFTIQRYWNCWATSSPQWTPQIQILLLAS